MTGLSICWALLALGGCVPAGQEGPKTPGILTEDDFRVVPWDRGSSPGSESPARFSLVRGGVRRTGILLIAPAAISASLKGAGGSMEFRCLVAPVYNIGDGMVLEIALTGGTGSRTLLRRRLDAAWRMEDREWIPLVVPLESPGDGAFLLLRLSGGDPGQNPGTEVDLVADWLVVAEPRVTTGRIDR